eukprot:933426-Pelagomonas_calceolata.AAC.3
MHPRRRPRAPAAPAGWAMVHVLIQLACQNRGGTACGRMHQGGRVICTPGTCPPPLPNPATPLAPLRCAELLLGKLPVLEKEGRKEREVTGTEATGAAQLVLCSSPEFTTSSRSFKACLGTLAFSFIRLSGTAFSSALPEPPCICRAPCVQQCTAWQGPPNPPVHLLHHLVQTLPRGVCARVWSRWSSSQQNRLFLGLFGPPQGLFCQMPNTLISILVFAHAPFEIHNRSSEKPAAAHMGAHPYESTTTSFLIRSLSASLC